MLWTNLFNARTFSASPGGIETEAKMKSETEKWKTKPETKLEPNPIVACAVLVKP